MKHLSIKLVKADDNNLVIVENLSRQAKIKLKLNEDQEQLDLDQDVENGYHDFNYERSNAIRVRSVQERGAANPHDGICSEEHPNEYLPHL